MLLKLYKKEDDKTLYWEAWPEGDDVVVHFGELGQQGETTTLSLPEFEPPDTAIQKHAEEARAAGFQEIDQEELYELIVQYKVESDAGLDDVQLAYQVEEVLNDCLGWTGLGHCDGSDVGDGTLNVYSYVVDPRLACTAVVEELKAAELLNDAVIAYQDHNEEFVVLWPEDFKGDFDY
jgi:hypothetical protein